MIESSMYATPQPFRIRPEKSSPFRQFLSIAITLVLTVGLAFILNQFVFQSFFVDGESMSPTLHTGDRLIVSRVERSWDQLLGRPYIPKRGQIVVVNGEASPTTIHRASELIKRVIGLPGDRIVIDHQTITVISAGGEAFNVDEKLGLQLAPTYGAQPQTITVPENSVFVVGDNRTQGGSLDSRVFGPVKSSLIDGRLAIRIMPFTQFRVF